MTRFSPDTLERVKSAVDIVEVISAHADLRRQGQRFTGLCPFHDERTPSFSVDPQEKLYYCFGCEAGGDVFRFVQEKEALSFPEAVESLAERYGIEIERDREDPLAEERRRRRARLVEALSRTAAFYSSYLWDSPKAAGARDYLAGRGMGEEVLKDFGVGFSPGEWDAVLIRGQKAGFSVDELAAAGLVQRGRGGGFYDRFRGRIMFPIRDARGRVLGFGARALRDSQQPKYLNSPEGETYHKSSTLFGIDRARSSIAKGGEAIVVEGYTDVLALHQAGIPEAVAVMGTAITPEQIATLSGLCDTITLALDADRAGQDAIARSEKVARERKMGIRVVRMPADTDPCEVLEKESPERFRELVAGAVGLTEHRVTTILDRAELGSPDGRDRALSELAPVIAGMQQSVARDELVRLVSERLDIGADLMRESLRRVEHRAEPRSNGDTTGPPVAPRALSPNERRERALLAMCIAAPEHGAEYVRRLTPEHLSSTTAGNALTWLREHLEDPLSGLPREDEELVSLMTQLVMIAEREPAPRHAMELNYLEIERRRVEGDIARASEDERMALIKRRADLMEMLRHVEMEA